MTRTVTNTAKRILIVWARTPEKAMAGRDPLALGVVNRAHDGWRFMPFTSAHKASCKGHKTWEAALPRWTGGLDGTESITMEPGESVLSAVRRIADRTRVKD